MGTSIARGCANRGAGTPPLAGSPPAVHERQATAEPAGAPLIPLLRPDLDEPVRPRSVELRHAVNVQEEVLRAGLLGVGASTHPPALAVFWLRRALYDTGPTSRL